MDRKAVIKTVVCVVLICLIWGGYFVAKSLGTDRILELRDDDFSWVYQVDEAGIDGNNFVLQGFAFELDKDAKKEAFEIVLQDVETKKRYFSKMEYTERTDVNEYFLCEYDYLQSGFVSVIKAKKLELDKRDYEVLLKRANERQTYQTGIYVSKGNLMYANPKEFESLDVEGTDLEKVVEDGILRVYRPDYGMYVYQYDGELYWIAEQEYEFDEEGKTHVQYQLDTTQIDRLPKSRLEGKWYWDNIGFDFSENELREINTGKYRVAKKALPTEYAIEKIWTGNYINEWIWHQYFRPFYRLDNK